MEYIIESTKTNARTIKLPITEDVAYCFMAKITDVNDNDEELIGTITDISHSFGKSGFPVDSRGRRGRARLKDLISNDSKDVESFTGKQAQTADGDETEY